MPEKASDECIYQMPMVSAPSPPLLDDAPAVPPSAGSAHVTQLGITLKGLRKLIEKVKQLCLEGAFMTDFDHLTTTELVYR